MGFICSQCCPFELSCFYQAGENPHVCVLICVHSSIATLRVSCALPSVCVLDIQLKELLRIITLYASASKKSQWSDLSLLTITRCALMKGDFNVDLEKHTETTMHLLDLTNSCSLAPSLPDTHTLLRTDHTIDFALTWMINIMAEPYEGKITSNQKPSLCEMFYTRKEMYEYCRTIWPALSLFLSYCTFGFWENL
jgi:hypothetical protein